MGKAWPWTDRLRGLVSDGPVSMAQAMAEMAALVPPGRAYRDGESQIEWQKKHATAKSTTSRSRSNPEVTDDEAKDARIRRGSRRLAYQAIWHQKRAGHVETYVDSGVRMLRLGPKAWADDDR